jgi:ATP-dependent Clp protease ATP-binding subunit ClpB
VGYEEGGQLTEAIRRKPYSVVLFDEVEKAHHDVFNTLLQVLDDGRLTDAQGRTADFRNTVIIMTSNIGSEYLVGDATSEGEIKPDARERVMAELRACFRPEFLNRLDDIVLFKPLTQAEIERIVDLMLNDLRTRLGARQMRLEVTAEAERFIARQGYDPVYGARPLRRFIGREVETRIGRALLTGDIRDGAMIRVEYSGDELTVSYDNSADAEDTAATGDTAASGNRGLPWPRQPFPPRRSAARTAAAAIASRQPPPASRGAATAISRSPGSPRQAMTRSPRWPRPRRCPSWWTCGHRGAAPAAR